MSSGVVSSLCPALLEGLGDDAGRGVPAAAAAAHLEALRLAIRLASSHAHLVNAVGFGVESLIVRLI